MKYLSILEKVMGVRPNQIYLPKYDCPSFKEWKKRLLMFDLTKEVVNLLDGIPQGTFYHPEFDALKHVYYVCIASICHEVGQISMGPLYSPTDTTLLEAAFLHDVGKSTHTNIGKNRIYSFGHADASARFVEKHKENITDFDFTYKIVKEHMNDPKKYDIPAKFFNWVDKEESKRLYSSESNKIELLINKCKEQHLYLKQKLSRKKVILLIGISGSGKSTYINKNFDKKYVICPDEIRRSLGNINDMTNNGEVWKLTKSIMQGKLNTHGKVVLDATNVNKWLRIQFMSQFNGCHKEAIFFPIEVDVAIERVNRDIKSGIARSDVPENVIRKQAKLLHRGALSVYNEFNTVKVIKI